MNYPLISEYIEAIKAAEDNFEELRYLRPVLGDDGLPVMTSGNFAVVFKMKDEATGKLYALKCFTKEQKGRTEAYHQIAEELKDVDSPYLVSLRYLDKELFVDTEQTDETEFPVLLMDWVEGKTLDKFIISHFKDKGVLEVLAYRFGQLAQWLIKQPYAHGDLKPDNIIVSRNGSLVLVDYDGMYVPAMKGQKARELGSPDFRHPQRTENDFDEHIDDFSLLSILLSLKAISVNPQLHLKYGSESRLLLSSNDYLSINKCELIKEIFPSEDKFLNTLVSLIHLSLDGFLSIKLCINSVHLRFPSSDSNDKAVVCRISMLPPYGREKAYARVVYKRNWSDDKEYLATYNLRLIYGDTCLTESGDFDCLESFNLFKSELPIGSIEKINLYDVSLDEISDFKSYGFVAVDLTSIRERKTGYKVESIPIASYGNRENAIELAKKELEESLASPFGKYVQVSRLS